jgi:hypothetical protein
VPTDIKLSITTTLSGTVSYISITVTGTIGNAITTTYAALINYC